MSCDLAPLSATSDVEWLISNVRRGANGAPYPAGSVSVTVRVYDPTGATPLTGAITAVYDSSVSAWAAIIPPISSVYALAVVRETVVADGRTLITDVDCTVVA